MSSDHAILDLGGEEDLQFTKNDFKPSSSSSQQQDEKLTSFPDPPSPGGRDTDRLIGDDGESKTNYSGFWSMSFYQQFFDVDDVDVQKRLLYAMVPIPGKSFLQHHIRPRPDLYGPFWICVTLIFSIAVSGNLANYFQTSLAGKAVWHYDFHKVSLASTAVFSYASLLPAGLYCYLWWASKGDGGMGITFLELLCLYGYSLTIYVPVSILWLIPVNWLQWIFVLAGAGLSGAVLFTTVWPPIRESAAKSAVIVLAIILVLHLLLAVGFMLYFFHLPSQANNDSALTTTIVAPAQNNSKLALEQAQDAVKEEEKDKPAALHLQPPPSSGIDPSKDDKNVNKDDQSASKDDQNENTAGKQSEADAGQSQAGSKTPDKKAIKPKDKEDANVEPNSQSTENKVKQVENEGKETEEIRQPTEKEREGESKHTD